MSEERWLPVVGHEGLYEVSDIGRVRRIAGGRGARAGRVLGGKISDPGYRAVSLGADHTERVHVLVAAAFIGPRPAGYTINHRDGDKLNNTVENLEYATYSENNRHAFATGLKRPRPADLRPRKTPVYKPRTTCKRGLHELTPENTRIYTAPDGKVTRACRVCRRLYRIALRDKQHGEAIA